MDGTEWSRTLCEQCGRSCKFYCPYCIQVVGKRKDVMVPQVELPIQVDIIFQDAIKKSTAIHAKLLAPKQVAIHTYPNEIPAFNPNDTVIVYPSEDATVLAELPQLDQIKHLVLIDSPWQKSRAIIMNEKLASLPRVKLKRPPSHSNFWRYHSEGEGCVSTIEAIECIVQEYCDARETRFESNLLFFFDLLGSYIRKRRENEPEIPMDEQVKAKYRRLRDQKEKGKRVREKRKAAKELEPVIRTGFEVEKMRCFNCRQFGHQATVCPEPCKFCKQPGHWNRDCKQRHKRKTHVPKVQA